MRHEAAPHIKQRQIQTNTTKFKLNPQVLLWRPERFLQGIPAGHSCKSSSKGFLKPCAPGTLKSWSFETMDTCTLRFLEPCNLGTLQP